MLKNVSIIVCLLFVCLSLGYPCNAQLWKDLESGFGCPSCTASGYEIAVDYENNALLLSGTLACGNDCEDYRMPARWNGHTWEMLGNVLTHINFITIGSYRGEIYSNNPLGDLSGPSFIKYNGTSWETIPNSITTLSMYQMLENDGYLYACGAFSSCAGEPANLVFRYDGEQVEPLVDFFAPSGFGHCMAFYKDTLYVGGRFFNDEDQVFNFASVYDRAVHQVGQGLNSECNVEAMCVHDGLLWIGGIFAPGNFDSPNYNYLAYYDGHTIRLSPWQPDGRVVALQSYNNELYMAGSFAHIEELESHCIAKINDFGYHALNPDTIYNHDHFRASYSPGVIRDMEIWNDTLYLAGAFGAIGADTTLNSIAKLNRSLSGGQSLLLDNYSLYPNPTQNSFTLQTQAYFNTPSSIVLYDATGRIVLTDTWPIGERKKEINLEHIHSGVYFVSVTTSSGITTKRLVKQ